MASNELEIVLKLVDEASAKLKEVTGQVKNHTNQIADTSKKAGDSISKSFKEANRNLRDFRQALIPMVVILAGIIKTTKDWAKTNEETAKAYDTLGKFTKGLSASIGSLLAPSIQGLSKLVIASTENITNFFNTMRGAYSKFFETVSFTTQFYTSFFTQIKAGTKITDAFADSMKTANQATVEMLNEFNKTVGLGGENDIIDLGTLTVQSEKDKKSENEKINLKSLKDLAIEIEGQVSENYDNMRAKAQEVMAMVRTSISSNLTDALVGVQSFAGAWKSIWQSIGSYTINKVLQKIIDKIFEVFEAGSGKKGKKKGIGSFIGGAIGSLFGGVGASIGSTLGSFLPFHSGGFIKAHSGLAVDEVPIIAQTGEGILSRKGMQSLGGINRLNELNSGISSNGGNTVNIYIQKADLSSDKSIEDTAEMLGFNIEKSLRFGRGIA